MRHCARLLNWLKIYDVMKKILIVDNYDSFTYNLSHMVKELGADVTVLRNDSFDLGSLGEFDGIILSPGPGIPSEAGMLMDVVRTYSGSKPLLGVCLGHQAIGEVFGARLVNMKSVCHGMQTECRKLVDDCIFDGLSERFYVGRYHSWVIDRSGFPDSLEVTAVADDGQIMAVRHREYDVRGIQFHPESVLTPQGKTIVGNWLGRCVP